MHIKHISLSRHFLILLLLAVLLLYAGYYFERELTAVEQWIASLGVFAPLGFVLLFSIAAPLLISVDVLCFAAGVLFSWPAGFFYSALATYAAAAVIYGIGHKLLHAKVRAWVAAVPRVALLDAVIAAKPFKMMLLLRLTPLPFAAFSYLCAVAGVGFWKYLAATSGILVYEAVLVYWGHAAKHVSRLFTQSRNAPPFADEITACGLIVSVLVLMALIILARKELRKYYSGP